MCSRVLDFSSELSQSTREVADNAMSLSDAFTDQTVPLDCIADMCRPLLELMYCHHVWGRHVLVSIGQRGIVWVSSDASRRLVSRAVDAVPLPENAQINHTSGAGDAFCSGFVYSIGCNTINGDLEAAMMDAINLGLQTSHKHLIKK